MIVAVGVDSVAIARIERLLRAGDRFARRVFTAAERAYCDGRQRPAESYAARFCAKEAVLKCLGTGLAQGLRFAEVEIERAPTGATTVRLHGEAGCLASKLGVRRWHVSLTHTGETATAFVVAEG